MRKENATDEDLNLIIEEIGLKQVELVLRNNIAEVFFNNPPHNYVSIQVLKDLCLIYEYFLKLQKESSYRLKGIIISSKNRRVFSSGASLDMLGSMKTNNKNRDEFMEISRKVKFLVEKYRIPAIAAINGICLGAGLEIALQCHYRICGKGVYLGFPEITLGFIPGAGGTQYLPRLIGRSKALYMMLSGKFFDAEEGFRMGVVDKVVPKKKVLDVARLFAQELCNQDPKATRYLIKAVDQGLDMSIAEGIKLEERLFWELVDDRITQNGISNSDVSMKIIGSKKQV